jgi:glutamyl-Q tRNA(Asp) synthetase
LARLAVALPPNAPLAARGVTPYVGRFAPSPTGPLHLGSLLSAVGSYLDARAQGGRWLLRIEDLDPARTVPGAAARMVQTLADFGLESDGAVLYQSTRTQAYRAAFEALRAAGHTFECSCSRRRISAANEASHYPGDCRSGPRLPGATATRFRVDLQHIERFTDRLQGPCEYALAELSDFVIRRRDDLFAYQLAVVVDDAAQGVSDVVRGMDLLESTPWQRALQRALGLAALRYAHLPLVVEAQGWKLTKSRRAAPIEAASAPALVLQTLQMLRQEPPPELAGAPLSLIWDWAIAHFDLARCFAVRTIQP